MTLLALLRLLVIRECVFVKRGKWRKGDGEGEKGRMCRWLLSQGGFSLLPNLNFNKGGLLVNAVCHDSRKKENSNA